MSHATFASLASISTLFLLAACGADAASPAPVAPTPLPAASQIATPAPPATPASSEPTLLTEEQARRDLARVPLASAMVDAYPNSGGIFTRLIARFSSDGKQVLFGSLRDGSPQVYLGAVDRPAEAPKALTQGPQRAFDAQFTRDGKSILFLRDQDGNENFAIWRVGVDGTGLTNLTPGEAMHRRQPVLPRGKPKTMIYSATPKTDPETTLFSQAIDGGVPKVIYKSPIPGDAYDVTADGSRVLFAPSIAASDGTLEEIDAATGKARRIYPPEGKKAGIYEAAYSADGKRILVATNEGGESSAVLALDPVSGKELARYTNESPKGAVLDFAVAPKGGVVAVRVDAGNHGEVRTLDARTLTLKTTVKVPLGDVLLGTFREDGRAFAVMISQPDHPADIFSVDVKSAELHPLRSDKRAGLESLPPIETSIATADAFDGLHIPINVYLPKGTSSAKLPTVVSFHGGPSWSSAVRWSPFNRFWLALGYAVIEPNVRGSTGFGRAYEMADNREKRADWLKDVETVNAWVKSQPWCDPQRVVVWGGSYGGYTTLMAITRQPSLWRAGVDMYGIANLTSLAKTTSGALRIYLENEFGDVKKDPALFEEFSPIRDVAKIQAPLFVYAGQNDPRVPRAESDSIVRAMRERQVPVEYMVAAGEGHSLDRRETKIEFLTRAARFLEDHAGGKR